VNYLQIPAPAVKKRMSTAEILLGPPVPKIDRLRSFSEDDFEEVVHEWAFGFLNKQYSDVKKMADAGDKGRDVIGFYADGASDIYQCKHYKNAIQPSDIWIEFGKLCHYTFIGDYKIPKSYFIVSTEGIGPTLSDILAEPKGINTLLAKAWATYCETKISKQPVLLEGAFKKYVDEFDFSIVHEKKTLSLIEEHSKTVYHASRFGGGLTKYRKAIPTAPAELQPREMDYIQQLFEVYSEKTGKAINSLEAIKLSSGFTDHFNEQRNSFFCAESLEIFSRENFPDSDPLPFSELKNDAYSLVSNLLFLLEKEDSFHRLVASVQEVLRNSFVNNPLSVSYEIGPLDKTGLCHHLANEKRLRWKAK
jgi:hypothetical protein